MNIEKRKSAKVLNAKNENKTEVYLKENKSKQVSKMKTEILIEYISNILQNISK